MTQRAPGGSLDVSLVAPFTAALRRWRLLVGIPVALGVVGVVYAMLTRGYTAVSSFVPETPGGQRAQLAGLAMQLGFVLGGGSEAAISVDFYRNLLQSRALLEEAIVTRYRFAARPGVADTLQGDLIELFHVPGENHSDQLRRAQGLLLSRVVVGIDRPANVVTMATTAPWPGLAEQINRRLLQLVNAFNVERRSSSAAAQRDFARGRLAEADSERLAAEGALRQFLERNIRYQDSPELVFEQMRLQKELDLRQQVYTQVAQAFEQARMDAVRDTPVITIIEQPEGSARPGSGLLRNGVLAAFFGLIVAIGIIVVSEYLTRQREERPDEFREFDRVWRETIGRLKPGALRRRAMARADPDGRQ